MKRASVDGEDFREIYNLNNRDSITYNTFVPISCGDIHRLETARAIVTRCKQPVNGLASSSTLFFGNHSIKWVQVVGKILDVFFVPGDDSSDGSFSLVDGLGGNPLKCYFNSRNGKNQQTLLNNQSVIILGALTGASRLEALNIKIIPQKEIFTYFLAREEILAVRKFILEKDAEIFNGAVETLKTIERPKLKITEVVHNQTSFLRRYMKRQKELWGEPDCELTLNTITIRSA